MTQSSIADKVVLITGVSSGLGRALARELLAQGACVAGTVRQAEQASAFEELAPGRALGVQMDITDRSAIATGVRHVIERFGRIDVLANNAGTGTVGAVEETSEHELEQIFDVNFFGGQRVINAVLPIMRRQRFGHILQFSSIAGFTGFPGLGAYAGAKAATTVVGETLAGELAPLGIDVTVLTIGVFYTEFAGRSLTYARDRIDDYEDTPADEFRNAISNLQGQQPNDPARGAAAIVRLLQAEQPPVHMALGADALDVIRKRQRDVEADVSAWEDVAVSARREDHTS